MSTGISDGVSPPGTKDSGSVSGPQFPRRRRVLIGVALALGFVVIAAVITGTALGAHYQPVGFGNMGGGIHGDIVTRPVNNFTPMQGQTYLPPQQSATGGMYVSLTNDGPLAVTIESASLNPPWAQGPIDRQGQALRDTGEAATYWPEPGYTGKGRGERLAGLVLRPGQYILVRLPVKTAGCWMPAHGYSVLFAFWVKVRFAYWTHVVQIWWTSTYDQSEGAIVAHEPESASQGGVCPS